MRSTPGANSSNLYADLPTASPPHLQGICELTRIIYLRLRFCVKRHAETYHHVLQDSVGPNAYPNPYQRTKSRRSELRRLTTPRRRELPLDSRFFGRLWPLIPFCSRSASERQIPTNSALFRKTLKIPCSDDSTCMERISTNAQ
jgi:hypothetical protein